MSRYSVLDFETRRVRDIVWRKCRHGYHVYLEDKRGSECVGQVSQNRAGRWTAVCFGQDLIGPRMIEGFARRWDATDYILYVGRHNSRARHEQEERAETQRIFDEVMTRHT